MKHEESSNLLGTKKGRPKDHPKCQVPRSQQKNMVMFAEIDYKNQFPQDPCEWYVYLYIHPILINRSCG